MIFLALLLGATFAAGLYIGFEKRISRFENSRFKEVDFSEAKHVDIVIIDGQSHAYLEYEDGTKKYLPITSFDDRMMVARYCTAQ